MADIRQHPCAACPYRRDVASGVWSAEEYDKLRLYDAPTSEQPFVPFSCHATPERLCHGWAVVHTSRGHKYDLIALRFSRCGEVPPDVVPLFSSGTEAAEHGMRDIDKPGDKAVFTMDRLERKYPRLRRGGTH